MEGVVIGENSIVAGHSFVADNTIIPPNSIVMGTPAKVVRTVQQLRRQPRQRHALSSQRGGLCPGRPSRLGRPEYEAESLRWKSDAEREFEARYGR